MMRFAVVLLAGLLLAGCATSGTDALAPKTAGSVNLKRYQGKWYELARMPMYFQRNCAQSEAHYTLRADGDVDVFNRCLTPELKWEEAKGTATPQVPGKTDKLWVSFDNWFTRLLPGVTKGDYWVLYVSDDYQTAIVGDPNRRYLWLLSRKPNVNADTREELLSRARQQGYDTTRLIWRVSDQKLAQTSK